MLRRALVVSFFVSSSFGSAVSCLESYNQKTFIHPIEALSKLKINSKPGSRAQFFGTSKKMFIRSGGYFFRFNEYEDGRTSVSPLKALAGLEDMIQSMSLIENVLWVVKSSLPFDSDGSKYSKTVQPFLESQLLVSHDDGESFSSVDMPQFKRIVDTSFGKVTEFATMSTISLEQIGGKKALVLNAGLGPSAWASYDNAKTWTSIVKGQDFWDTMGYSGYYEVSGEKIFFGGEHPLDTAYLKFGTINSSGTVTKLVSPKIPNLDNRRIQFIQTAPGNKKFMFAGMEGALLVSYDAGKSWAYAFKETLNSVGKRERRVYPYFLNVIFPYQNNSEIIIASGQGQVGLGTVLISRDAGKHWQDFSEVIVKNYELVGINKLEDGQIIFATRKEVDLNKMESGDKITVFSLDLSKLL